MLLAGGLLGNVECGQSMAFALQPDAVGRRRSRRCSPMARPNCKSLYLEKIIAGAWTGTMNLTEPQAGFRSGSAPRQGRAAVGDGSYKITGQKIFITYGEHELTENIIHLVLARLPDAPAGTRGISLFLVPKFLVNARMVRHRRTQRCPLQPASSISSAFTPRPPAR